MARSVIDILSESVGSITAQLANAIALNDVLREQNQILADQLISKNQEIRKLNDTISELNNSKSVSVVRIPIPSESKSSSDNR